MKKNTERKAVCVNVDRINGWSNFRLKKDMIYTVIDSYTDFDGDNVFLIKEFNHAWLASRFRLLDYDFVEEVCEMIKQQTLVKP